MHKCEICHQEFGIRYEQRCHRMVHFNLDGTLTDEARQTVQRLCPELSDICLNDLEAEFVPIKITLKPKAGDKSEDTRTEDKNSQENNTGKLAAWKFS